VFMCRHFSLAEDDIDFLAIRLDVSAIALANYQSFLKVAV